MALVTTPIGLLITAVVTLAGVSFSRNTEAANAALDRQMAITANSSGDLIIWLKELMQWLKLQQLNNTSFQIMG